MNIKKLKGFRDILPEESAAWQRVEQSAQRVFAQYGFHRIGLPLLEQTPLFKRSIGEATDIVEKEMYTFPDSGGSMVTLRPEGTASAVRAYVENGFARSQPKARWYYSGPMFRRERPQKGRFRQFHQIGAECFGWGEPAADADVLCMLWAFCSDLGLSERVSLEINSLGCDDDRAAYVARLGSYLEGRMDSLCENCKKRVQRNPLRVLDCKSVHCQKATADAPSISEGLCGECDDHFTAVRSLLEAQKVPFQLNPRMVRGLDYYNRTTFELLTGELGAQNAVAAGGRYDGLVELLGGSSVPALGFAVGVERLVLMLGEEAAKSASPVAHLVYRGEGTLEYAFELRQALISAGVATEIDFEPRSIKAQLRAANNGGARFALIVGESEVADGTVAVKDLVKGEQTVVDRAAALALVCSTSRGFTEQECGS